MVTYHVILGITWLNWLKYNVELKRSDSGLTRCRNGIVVGCFIMQMIFLQRQLKFWGNIKKTRKLLFYWWLKLVVYFGGIRQQHTLLNLQLDTTTLLLGMVMNLLLQFCLVMELLCIFRKILNFKVLTRILFIVPTWWLKGFLRHDLFQCIYSSMLTY